MPDSKLMDCPPHDIDVKTCLAEAKDYDHVIIHTSTPSLKNDCKVAEAIKAQKPGHEDRFRRRAHGGVADGNLEGVAGD